MDFYKVIYENSEKNPIHFITNISAYSSHRHVWTKVSSVFKNSHYAYIPPYMHKALPTLGNEKEQQQIEFYEKSSGELILSRVTKDLKMSYFARLTGEMLKNKGYISACVLKYIAQTVTKVLLVSTENTKNQRFQTFHHQKNGANFLVYSFSSILWYVSFQDFENSVRQRTPLYIFLQRITRNCHIILTKILVGYI